MPTLALILALAGCRSPRPATAELQPTTPVAPAPPPAWHVEELASGTVVAVGDLLMHGMVQKSAAEADELDEEEASQNHGGFDVLYEGVAADIAAADLAFANLETPVAPDAGKGVRPMVFNAPAVLLDSLAGTGFDVVSFANNHVYDQGRDGLAETVERLDAHPLAHVGAGATCADAQRARLMNAGGISVAFIGTTDLYNADLNETDDVACSFTFDETAVLASAAAAREAGAELVVMSIHWGVEYETTPQQEHVDAAHRLIAGGVDVILGHHAHVLQPIEVVPTPDGRLGLVVYSLGNFVSNQSAWYVLGLHKPRAANPRDGLMVRFRVVRKQYGRGDKKVVRAELADLEAVPLWTLNNTKVGRKEGEPVVIRVVRTLDRIAELETTLAGLAPEDEDALVVATRELAEMNRRVGIVGDIVGSHLIEGYPSSSSASSLP